jgi:DNA-binding response OmpR family regulator
MPPVLVADDDPVVREVLERTLRAHGFHVVIAPDGERAWELVSIVQPLLLVLDWEMPGLNGLELLHRVRLKAEPIAPYIVLLTSHDSTRDIVRGLSLGADDYVRKPFHVHELIARVQVGARVVELRRALVARVNELEFALAHIHRLEQLLPICASCKEIRDENNHWQTVERYLMTNAGIRFTHGICPKCAVQWRDDDTEPAN